VLLNAAIRLNDGESSTSFLQRASPTEPVGPTTNTEVRVTISR
jgi:hypothetical protein